MNYKSLMLLILFSPLSYAENINITIPSITTPEGISLQKYKELNLEYNRKESTTGKQLQAVRISKKADADSKSEAALKANEEVANKKAEARKIASSAKRDFENKVKNTWRMPLNSSGQKATVRVLLSENGSVKALIVNALNPELKSSLEQAVFAAAPYPMPSDPEARSQARSFTASFTVQ